MNLEGLPPGVKAVRWGRPNVGEWVIWNDMQVKKVHGGTFAGGNYLVVAADNAYGCVDLHTMQIPDGYEWTGEVRGLKDGDIFIGVLDHKAYYYGVADRTNSSKFMILRKKKQKFVTIKFDCNQGLPLGPMEPNGWLCEFMGGAEVSRNVIEE